MRRIRKLIAGVLFGIAAALPSHAQIASSAPSAASISGWTFNVTPYLWLPTISAGLQANKRNGGSVSTEVSAGVLDYISAVNFGMLIGGEARYDRFTLMTDLVYLNTSQTTSTARLSTVNLGSGPIDIPRSRQLSTGTRMATTIWGLAGGYTLLEGEWGNLDAVVGTRMLNVGSTTNYLLTAEILAPDGTIALARDGSLNIGKTFFNAIGGVTGRINIPNSRFYLPFYLDAGGGAPGFTAQAYGGVAYGLTDAVDVSLGYRYLTFQNGSGSGGVHNLSLRGAILVSNFHF